MPPPLDNTDFDIYHHQRSFMDSPSEPNHQAPVVAPDTLVFFRYMFEQFDAPIRAYSYWTALETGCSKYASESLGIAARCCQYRTEWRCPISIALKNITVGETRMGENGAFTEYLVRIEVLQSDVTWHIMDVWPASGA